MATSPSADQSDSQFLILEQPPAEPQDIGGLQSRNGAITMIRKELRLFASIGDDYGMIPIPIEKQKVPKDISPDGEPFLTLKRVATTDS